MAEKKADVVEHPEVFHHVGLLINAPTGTCRFALYQVIRRDRRALSNAERLPIKPDRIARQRERKALGVLVAVHFACGSDLRQGTQN
jgi:hypothetical protein